MLQVALTLLPALLPQGDPVFRPLDFGDPAEHAYDVPFFPGTTYDSAIPVPEQFLGTPVGRRLARHDEVLAAFRAWSDASPRMTLAPYGKTYEGRDLVYAVITSEENHANLDAIRGRLASLADPRGLEGEGAGQALVATTPAVAWLGYSIHGDETSGVDAALAVAHHLVAGTSADVTELLREVVVVLDPCMNPDGRMRFVSQVEQNAGYVASLDVAARQRGHWPYGRGNHYLFDMNRDWMAGVCPETRGRWRVAREFHPQLFVDAHEMGALDTYLFYPQSEPRHPALPATLLAWQVRFAADQAAAFDAHGWGYYTREWADAWYPGYSDAWGSMNGAIGILYEQARIGGQPLRRASGRVESYRESVHGHAVSSVANLTTLATNRQAILGDYLAGRQRNCDASRAGGERAYVVVRGRHPDRERRLVSLLVAQGVEVWSAGAELQTRDVVGSMGAPADERAFPPGSLVVPAAQPQATLVEAYLAFDPRMGEEYLLEERESLERGEGTKIYDVTAWDLSRAFDLDAYWCTPRAGGELERVAAPSTPEALVPAPDARPYALIVDGRRDASVRFAARCLDAGLALHLADEAFTSAGRSFTRGSLLLRRHENPQGFEQVARRAARATGVELVATGSGRSSDDGPDLGGGHFELLERPRVAMLAGAPVSSADFGHLWQLLDEELRLPVALLEAADLPATDLRPYNVLVLPPAGGLDALLGPMAEDLEAWVRSGGTLIACGSSAAALTGADLSLSSVVRRRDALEERDAYAFAARRELAAREVRIDLDALWDGPAEPDAAQGGGEEREDVAPSVDLDPDPERRDAWERRFSPSGVYLRALVDEKHWATVGCAGELPVFVAGGSVLWSAAPVETPLRLGGAAGLRLGGLLWPEARGRLEHGAWLTVERRGHGQVVLFASPPAFRGFAAAGARLFANVCVYGPGAGARPPLGD